MNPKCFCSRLTLWVGLLLLSFFPSQILAEILVSSNLGGTGSQVLQKTSGVIKLEIYSSSPLTQVELNGQEKKLTHPQFLALEEAFTLETNQKHFELKVKNQAGESISQSYKFIYLAPGQQAEVEAAPFGLLLLGKLVSTDNILLSQDNPQRASKLALAALPQYRLQALDRKLDLSGLFYRERILNRNYKEQELVINRLQAQAPWQAGDPTLTVKTGYTEIGTETSGLGAVTAVEKNLFLGASLERPWGEDKLWLQATLTYRNLAERENGETDGDGLNSELEGIWSLGQEDLKQNLGASLEQNDAKGELRDYWALAAKYHAQYAWSQDLDLVGKARYRQTRYLKDDLYKGDKEVTNQTRLEAGGYLRLPWDGLLGTAELVWTKQDSNLSSQTYQETQVALGAIYRY